MISPCARHEDTTPVRRTGTMASASAILAGASALGVAVGGAYAAWFKPHHDRWGATDGEVAMPLPGDQLIAEPATQNTRAITIDAPPEAVWPWLAQIGADRGGFYSYDWLEDLFGLGIHSADEVVDQWQDVQVGDVVFASRSRRGGWYVVDVDPGRALVLLTADLDRGRPARRTDPAGWEFAWAFLLLDRGDRSTRLLVRERVATGSPLARLWMSPVATVSFLMTRRMMLGIKKRSERRWRAGPTHDVGAAGQRDRWQHAGDRSLWDQPPARSGLREATTNVQVP